MVGPFMTKKTDNMTCFTEWCVKNIFFTWVRVFPLYGLFFTQFHSGKPMFNLFVNICWLKHVSLYKQQILL